MQPHSTGSQACSEPMQWSGTGPRALVVVLCRPPWSSDCKTRLAADIGRAAATAIYERCLSEALRSAVATGAAVRISVAGRPIAMAGIADVHAPEADIVRQIDAVFAQRQRHEIDRGLNDGRRPVALLASDVAEPPGRFLCWALATAVDGVVAIVPSHDGGYSILASSAPLPEMDAVPMSSGRTLDLLRSTLHRHGRKVVLSPQSLPDVDVATDLDRLAREMRMERR